VSSHRRYPFSTKPTDTERNLAKPNETKQNQTQNFIHRFNGSTVLEEGKYTKKT